MEMTQSSKTHWENPIGLDGMEFIEFAAPDPEKQLEKLFVRWGFREMGKHKTKNVSLYAQGGIHFVVNRETDSFAHGFSKHHGPSICATGFRVKDAKKAFEETVKRGAKPCPPSEHHSFPAIYGIGDSIIYFIDKYQSSRNLSAYENDFYLTFTDKVPGFGLLTIDHMTNNVPVGGMQYWCDFYSKIFNFREVRYFDIKGKQTGLFSKVMRSPCGRIIIPINEPTGQKSQIQEYLDEYQGPGIQHVALLTADIVPTVRGLKQSKIEFLDTIDTYFDLLAKRLPNVTEDIDQLREQRILADGDPEGYLLQIFSKNLIGPIFFEVIQRKNHMGFGEGNFQALFDSIEEDQRRRGYL